MKDKLQKIPHVVVPAMRNNRVLAALAIGAVAASIGFWVWNARTKAYPVRMAAGVELKYRKELVGVLCDEAKQRDLLVNVQSNTRSIEALDRVNRGELDFAVIPAGLAMAGEKIRQVAVFDCEPLHLFVRPDLQSLGIAGLKGRRVYLGSPGGGGRVLAGEVLSFAGLKADIDYTDENLTYQELIALPPDKLPDAVFSLCPLPSPLGERLVQQNGYRLIDLPYGAAMALRKPEIEDTCIPANTYSANPPVPDHPLHTVGTRAVMIANTDVPRLAVRRLMEVFYEGDFARRVGIPPLNEGLIQRSGEYPNHAGTNDYLHRHDPWVNKSLVDNIGSLKGLLVSIASAVLLLWQWYRKSSTGGLNDHLRVCTRLEIDALKASFEGQFGREQLEAAQAQLVALKYDVLEKHDAGVFTGDQQFTSLLERIESLQHNLPTLVNHANTPLHRKAA